MIEEGRQSPMQPKVEIRRPTRRELLEHRDELAALLATVLQTSMRGLVVPPTAGHVEYERLLKYDGDGSAVLIGAFADDEMVGLLWAYERTDLGIRKMHVTQFGVLDDYQSGGIGSAMLRELESIAEGQGIVVIELMATLNNRVIGFYQHNGFHPKRVLLEKHISDES